VTDETSLGAIVHHPKFGIVLKQRMEELGLRCVVRWRDQENPEPITAFEFLRGYLQPEEQAGEWGPGVTIAPCWGPRASMRTAAPAER
jgi:hypothetical protein